MSVGVELACARRVCGLSIQDISKRTNVAVGTLAAIENDQVGDIPTADVRGALRAYAAALQLDPEDVIHRYFAEFEARRHVVVLPVSPCSVDEFPSEATIATDIEYRDSIQPSDHRDASDIHGPWLQATSTSIALTCLPHRLTGSRIGLVAGIGTLPRPWSR